VWTPAVLSRSQSVEPPPQATFTNLRLTATVGSFGIERRFLFYGYSTL
jgi:hypothetical protein